MLASESFKMQVRQAVAVWEGAARTFQEQNYTHTAFTGYEVIREYTMYSVAEFQAAYGCSPQVAGLVVETLHDDHGRSFSGVLLQNDTPGLQVRSFHRVGESLADLLQTPKKQLREAQASDFARVWYDDSLKLLPKGLAQPGKAVLMSQVPRLAKEGLEAQERRKQEAERLAEMAAGSSLDTTGQVGAPIKAEPEEESEEDEDLVDEAVVEAPLLQSQLKGRGKGARGKAKAKAKGKAHMMKDKTKPASPQRALGKAASSPTKRFGFSALRSKTAHSAQGGAKSSTSSGKGQRLSPRGEILKKAREWIDVLDVSKMLSGKALGHKCWQAGCTLDSLLLTHKGDEATLRLAAHLDIANLAKDRLDWGLKQQNVVA